MIDALQISQSGLRATQEWIDLISNNISNSQTVGFKKGVIQFSDLVSGQVDSIDSPNNGLSSSGMGTQVFSKTSVFSLGSFQATDQVLDLAINGNGFFEVIMDDGTIAYTKVGRLSVNSEGRLTLLSGEVLSDDIIIPPDVQELTIGNDGVVEAVFDGSTDILELGTINLASIVNPSDMKSIGQGLYQLTDKNSEAVMFNPGEGGVGNLIQGYLESSNVSLIEEMTNLVLAQRAYQLNARLIQVADSILETANNIRR